MNIPSADFLPIVIHGDGHVIETLEELFDYCACECKRPENILFYTAKAADLQKLDMEDLVYKDDIDLFQSAYLGDMHIEIQSRIDTLNQCISKYNSGKSHRLYKASGNIRYLEKDCVEWVNRKLSSNSVTQVADKETYQYKAGYKKALEDLAAFGSDGFSIFIDEIGFEWSFNHWGKTVGKGNEVESLANFLREQNGSKDRG